MKYLMDTCALIDMLFAPERLSARAQIAIVGDNALCVSIASFLGNYDQAADQKAQYRGNQRIRITSDLR